MAYLVSWLSYVSLLLHRDIRVILDPSSPVASRLSSPISSHLLNQHLSVWSASRSQTSFLRERTANSKFQHLDGETSCLTLGAVVKLRANTDDAQQIARLLPATGTASSGNAKADAQVVGDSINELVKKLDLSQTLTEIGVSKDQIPIIVERATNGVKEDPLRDSVTQLVERLY